MTKRVAVVVGAGTMGAGIAADLANAGYTVHLLDQSIALAEQGKQRISQSRPPLLYHPELADRIVPGSAENLAVCSEAHWVVEAIAENLTLKQALFARLEAAVGPETLVTSNTSGLSLAAMVEGRTPEFTQRFFGTHFFNPPRYLRLVEVVPTPLTDRRRLDSFIAELESQTNHRVVVAKDTPGFISTRLWITHLMDTIHTAIKRKVPVEVVDALTGPALGRPRSATFRMADLVGLDIFAAIAQNQYDALPDDPLRERLLLPEIVKTLLAEGRTGQKAGAGFYKREGREILALDWETLTYRPRNELDSEDGAGAQLVEDVTARFLAYATSIAPEIADSHEAIDRAMCWGFGWERGPFGSSLAPTVHLDDDALIFELKGKLNVFDPTQCAAVIAAVEEAERRSCPLVFVGQGSCFSAGYDLKRLSKALEAQDLGAIDADMRQCQEAFLRVKHAQIPTVAAVRGFTLGAGCELALHCGRIVAAPETVLGLPECAVGVIPCGGGVKEALYRFGSAQAALEKICFNENSQSALDAQKRGWLRAEDSVVANDDQLLPEALRVARLPRPPKTQAPQAVGEVRTPESLAGYDRILAEELAWVLTAGESDEQSLLDRERAAFLRLAQHPEALERMRRFVR